MIMIIMSLVSEDYILSAIYLSNMWPYLTQNNAVKTCKQYLQKYLSDYSFGAPLVANVQKCFHAESEYSDQSTLLCRMFWVFGGHICHFEGLAMTRFIKQKLTESQTTTWPQAQRYRHSKKLFMSKTLCNNNDKVLAGRNIYMYMCNFVILTTNLISEVLWRQLALQNWPIIIQCHITKLHLQKYPRLFHY